MAIKKVVMHPPNAHSDEAHPKTSADVVVTNDGSNVQAKLDATVNSDDYTDQKVLNKVKEVDGYESGLVASDSEKVGGVKITVGTTAPSSPTINDIWIDTN